jgi:hypothetical protein
MVKPSCHMVFQQFPRMSQDRLTRAKITSTEPSDGVYKSPTRPEYLERRNRLPGLFGASKRQIHPDFPRIASNEPRSPRINQEWPTTPRTASMHFWGAKFSPPPQERRRYTFGCNNGSNLAIMGHIWQRSEKRTHT